MSPSIHVTTAFRGKLSGSHGANILEKILGFAEAVQTGKEAKGVFKVDQTTTKEAGIFGWLINSSTKGVLLEGQKIGMESVAILDRVFTEIAKQELETGRSDGQ